MRSLPVGVHKDDGVFYPRLPGDPREDVLAGAAFEQGAGCRGELGQGGGELEEAGPYGVRVVRRRERPGRPFFEKLRQSAHDLEPSPRVQVWPEILLGEGQLSLQPRPRLAHMVSVEGHEGFGYLLRPLVLAWPQDASQALDVLAVGGATGEDHGDVRLWDVYALVEDVRGDDGPVAALAEAVQDFLALAGRRLVGDARDEKPGRERVDLLHALREHDGAVLPVPFEEALQRSALALR